MKPFSRRRAITAWACQFQHGAVTRSPGYHCKVAKRVLFTMDRVHTRSYKIHTPWGDAGKQLCDLSPLQMTGISTRIRKVIFSGFHRQSHFQAEKCFCLWNPGKSELKYLSKENLKGFYLFMEFQTKWKILSNSSWIRLQDGVERSCKVDPLDLVGVISKQIYCILWEPSNHNLGWKTPWEVI